MNQNINNLIFVLREMVEAFQKLLVTATEKQQELIAFDGKRLERSIEKEVELLDQVMLLEERSNTILHEINNVFFKTNTLLLGKFVEECAKNSSEGTEDLNEVYGELKEISAKLKEVNEQNQNLARFSLGAIKETIRFICKESTEGTVYKHSGEMERTGSMLSIVDTQV